LQSAAIADSGTMDITIAQAIIAKLKICRHIPLNLSLSSDYNDMTGSVLTKKASFWVEKMPLSTARQNSAIR